MAIEEKRDERHTASTRSHNLHHHPFLAHLETPHSIYKETHHLSANLTTPSPGRSIAAAITTPAMLAWTRRSPSPALSGNPETLTVVGRLSRERATRGSPAPLPRSLTPEKASFFPLPLPLLEEGRTELHASGPRGQGDHEGTRRREEKGRDV